MIIITWEDFSDTEAWKFKGYIPGRQDHIVHLYKSKAEKILDVFVRYEFYHFIFGSYRPKSFDIEEAKLEVENIINTHISELKKQIEFFGI